MMKDEQLVVDLSKLYLGIEEYETYMEGKTYNVKSFEIYTLTGHLGCDNNMRYFYTNMSTADELTVDQDGYVVRYHSKDRNIKSLTDIKPFKETIDLLLKNTSAVVSHMEGGEESVEFFNMVQAHMDDCDKKKIPPYANLDCFYDIVTAVPNIYILSYGNPLTGESQLQCMNEFIKER